jgi:hypothetical protein
MSRPRLDPSAPTSVIGTAVTAAVRDRVIELAAEQNVSKSAAARQLLELGIAALDAGEDED